MTGTRRRGDGLAVGRCVGEVRVEGLKFGVRSAGVDEADQGQPATSQAGVPVFSQPACDDFAGGGLCEQDLSWWWCRARRAARYALRVMSGQLVVVSIC